MTKRELIEALEALDCSDYMDVIIDEDHNLSPDIEKVFVVYDDSPLIVLRNY